MKQAHGITMISLVVTIIILIILAGITLNLTVGENGLISQAQKAKENMEIAKIKEEEQMNQLYEQMETGESGYLPDKGTIEELQNKLDTLKQEFENFKKQIAEAITQEGVEMKQTASATEMAEGIHKIATQQYAKGYQKGMYGNSGILAYENSGFNPVSYSYTLKPNKEYRVIALVSGISSSVPTLTAGGCEVNSVSSLYANHTNGSLPSYLYIWKVKTPASSVTAKISASGSQCTLLVNFLEGTSDGVLAYKNSGFNPGSFSYTLKANKEYQIIAGVGGIASSSISLAAGDCEVLPLSSLYANHTNGTLPTYLYVWKVKAPQTDTTVKVSASGSQCTFFTDFFEYENIEIK